MVHFKLDENADPRWKIPLLEAGHTATTAAEKSLQGANDEAVARTCRSQRMCLITADLDFAQILDYPPKDYSGIIVLRHPRPTILGMRDLLRQGAVATAAESPVGKLWIVEPGRIRIHDAPAGE